MSRARLRLWQAALLLVLLVLLVLQGLWCAMTCPGLLPNFMLENDRQASFFSVSR